MKYNPEKHHRRSIRLPHYNYSSPGYYFVTICTCDWSCWLGDVADDEMVLNEWGRIVESMWQWLAKQYKHVELDEFVVMPNHLHGIIVLNDYGCRGGSRTVPTYKRKPLGRLIGAFKTVSTKQINQIRNTPGKRIWQRNYYEHVIRNEDELLKIREYIINNPSKWETDRNHPDNMKT